MRGLVSSMPLKRPYRTKFRVFSWEAISIHETPLSRRLLRTG
jgi:hypothetical protein